MPITTTPMMLVITSNDEVMTVPYTGEASLRETIYGYPEIVGSESVYVDPKFANGSEEIPVMTYCSRDMIVSHDERFDRINAAASLLMEREVRGNLAILVDRGEGLVRGFQYEEQSIDGISSEMPCECWSAKQSLKEFISDFYVHIRECHDRFDGKKDISTRKFIEIKELEMSVE